MSAVGHSVSASYKVERTFGSIRRWFGGAVECAVAG